MKGREIGEFAPAVKSQTDDECQGNQMQFRVRQQQPTRQLPAENEYTSKGHDDRPSQPQQRVSNSIFIRHGIGPVDNIRQNHQRQQHHKAWRAEMDKIQKG